MEKTILVLEDERPLLEAIKSKLETYGFTVVVARAVEQALGYLKEGVKVDAIWLDHYLLGKEDGLDFVTQLKNEGSNWKKIPVFVVSNTASPDKIQSYLRLGINKYYSKVDYRLEQIITDIKEFLEKGDE